MSNFPEELFDPVELHPNLRQAFGSNPPDFKVMPHVAVPVVDPKAARLEIPKHFHRSDIFLFWGDSSHTWHVDSLKSLLRGDKVPPELGAHPKAYNACFALFDLHIVELANLFGEPRDEELREIVSTLRRRPDGKSLGFTHDYLWQACALILGTYPLSEAEFEAILTRLERSCRTFSRGASSRNFATTLRNLHGRK